MGSLRLSGTRTWRPSPCRRSNQQQSSLERASRPGPHNHVLGTTWARMWCPYRSARWMIRRRGMLNMNWLPPSVMLANVSRS